MNKKIIFCIIFLLSILSSFASDLFIKEIIYEGNEVTSRKFIEKLTNISPGDKWNNSVKNATLRTINSQRYVVEKVSISEKIVDENMVIVTIKIEEKLPFILVPFFTYTNNSGFMPKLIFRHYNVAGWGKYFGSKIEFLPTSHIGLFLDWRDNYLFNIENLVFGVSLTGTTSYPNYEIKSSESIPPLGVLTWSGDRWSSENKNKITASTFLNYTIPNYNIALISGIDFTYENILANEKDATEDRTKPILYKPSANLGFRMPITSFFQIGSTLRYRHEFEILTDKKTNVQVEYGEKIDSYYQLKNKYNPVFLFDLIFPNTEHAYNLTLTFAASYVTQDNKVVKTKELSFKEDDLHKAFTNNALDVGVFVNFTKRFNINPNLSNSISLRNQIIQRVFEYNDQYQNYTQDRYKDYELWKDVSNTLKLNIWLTNHMNYRFYKRHHFSFKFSLFYYYNDTNTYNDYFTKPKGVEAKAKLAQVEKSVYKVDSDYIMGVNTGDIEGYAGALLNIFYRVPLFNFTTPSFLTFESKRTLEWDAFFTFFLDAGLAQNYDNKRVAYQPYILNLGTEKLNLFPGLAGGARFEAIPKFVPALVTIELGIDLWKLLRDRNIGANITFSFGIDNQ